jgi:diguanylate cyclase (GGDEF)-like protein
MTPDNLPLHLCFHPVCRIQPGSGQEECNQAMAEMLAALGKSSVREIFFDQAGENVFAEASARAAANGSPAEGVIIPALDDVYTYRAINVPDGLYVALAKGELLPTRTEAVLDPLTGLCNRAGLKSKARFYLSGPDKTCLLFLDLDGFKAVNDTYGHKAGDAVLVEVARRIESIIRETDMAARLGGDEFVILCGHIKHGVHSALLAKRLLADLRRPVPIEGGEACVGVSIGISIHPDHAGSLDDLLAKADAAMYRAKHIGKGCYCFYQPTGA